MSVKIKGLEKLLNGSANEMSIKQKGDSYSVVIKNNRLTLFPEEVVNDKGNDVECIKEFVSLFLKYMKITKLDFDDYVFDLVNGIELCAYGNKELLIQIDADNYNDFDEIFKLVADKYARTRNRFLKNSDVMIYNLELGDTSTECKYEYNSIATCYELDREQPRKEVKLSFYSDDVDLLCSDKEFISNFIYNKLSSIGCEARVLDDDGITGIKSMGKTTHYYICCDDLIICFENKEQFQFIFNIVDVYNSKLNTGKKRVRKEGE